MQNSFKSIPSLKEFRANIVGMSFRSVAARGLLKRTANQQKHNYVLLKHESLNKFDANALQVFVCEFNLQDYVSRLEKAQSVGDVQGIKNIFNDLAKASNVHVGYVNKGASALLQKTLSVNNCQAERNRLKYQESYLLARVEKCESTMVDEFYKRTYHKKDVNDSYEVCVIGEIDSNQPFAKIASLITGISYDSKQHSTRSTKEVMDAMIKLANTNVPFGKNHFDDIANLIANFDGDEVVYEKDDCAEDDYFD